MHVILHVEIYVENDVHLYVTDHVRKGDEGASLESRLILVRWLAPT